MNHRSSQSPPMAFGVRALTMILLGLFFVTAAIFILFPDERAPEPLQEKVATGKSIFTLSEVIPEPKYPVIPGAVEADPKKLDYNLGIEDATGRGNVRASNAKIGVDYKVSKNSTVGVEASRKIHDAQDAAAWERSVEDENAAQAKYKLSF